MIHNINRNIAMRSYPRLTKTEISFDPKNIKHTATIKALQKDLNSMTAECMRTQRELLRQKSFVTRLFTNATQAIAIISENGDIIKINNSFSKLFGFDSATPVCNYNINSIIPVESLEIENDLKLAIKNNELLLHFQPIIESDGLAIKGFEALIRWNHPTKGMILPDKFISIAEDSELILPIGQYVIEQAIIQIKEWEDYFFKHSLSISVNVSVKQVLENDFGQMVISLIAKYNIQPECLQIEITESVLIKHTELAIEQLIQVRDAGVRVVLDDFGTGYSSLSYLRKFPTDTLKIDKSFINDLGKNNIDSEIVKTIINLAKNLRINVVAEGVEDKAQLAHLQDLSCDYVQGYLFSKPVEKNMILEMLQAI